MAAVRKSSFTGRPAVSVRIYWLAHVHLLVEAHPAMDLSRFVGNLKTVSARHIRKEFADHLAMFYWKAKFRNNAYAVVSAGGHASIEQLITYVRDQEKPPA